jgi:HlyD family secretion protein
MNAVKFGNQNSSINIGHQLRIPAVILVIGVLVFVGWSAMHRPIQVATIRPIKGDIVNEVFGTGTLESKVVVNLSSKIVGKVIQVNADEGDSISAGQCLARLESDDFTNAVRLATTQRDQAQAELEKAAADSLRQRILLEKQFISQADYDVSNTAYRVALANLRAAEASIEVTRAKLKDTQILSPTAGLILTRNLELGSTIVPGAAIFRISASRPWIVTQVDERATGKLAIGQHARIIFESNPGQDLSGTVVQLSPEVDRVTEEREVDICLDQLPVNAFLGARVNAYIATGRKSDVLTIPLATIVRRDGKPGVYLVINGKAHWQGIQTGLQGRERIEVSQGLTGSEDIIQLSAENRTLISEGVKVKAAARRSES